MKPIVAKDVTSIIKRTLPPAAIFIVAFLLRFFYILQFKGDPFLDCLFLDPLYYSDMAKKIASGDILAGSEIFEMTPLYPYFLAFFYRFVTTDLFTIRLVQIIIGSTSCVLVYAIGREVFKTRPPAFFAGIVASMYGYLIMEDGIIMKTFLAVFFVLLMTLILLRSERRPSAGFPYFAGICLGLSALIAENIVLLIPVVPLWFLTFRNERLKARILMGLFFIIGAFTVILPITIRNYYVGGEFVLITSGGGEVFFTANNPDSDGTYKAPDFIIPSTSVEHVDFRRKASELTGRKLTRGESSSYWFHRGLRFIIENPMQYIRLELRKLLFFWNYYEYPDNHNYYLHRMHSGVLGGPVIGFGVVAPFAIAGIFLSIGQMRRFAVLHIVFAAYLVTFLIVFNYARFRLPVVPFLILFGVYSIWWTMEKVRERKFWPPLLVIGVLPLLFFLVNRDMMGRDPYKFGMDVNYSNLANCYQDAEDYERAIGYFEKSLFFNPRQVVVFINMGDIFAITGKPGLAEEMYMRAAETGSRYANVHAKIGDFFASIGKLDMAINEYERAVSIKPQVPEYHTVLGFAMMRNGDYTGAIEAFTRAVRLRPDFAPARYGLSEANLALQQKKKAVKNPDK